MSNEVRIALRTKTSDTSVLASDLSSREIVYGNNQKSIFYKDVSGDLKQFGALDAAYINDEETYTINKNTTWSSEQIVNYIENNTVDTSQFFNQWLILEDGEGNPITADIYDVTNSLPVDHAENLYIYTGVTDIDGTKTHNYIYYGDLEATRTYIQNSGDGSSLIPGLCCYVSNQNFTYVYSGETLGWQKLAKDLSGGGTGGSSVVHHYELNSLRGDGSSAADMYHLSSVQQSYLTDGSNADIWHIHDHSNLLNLYGMNTITNNRYYHLNYSDSSYLTGGSTTPTSVHKHKHGDLSDLSGYNSTTAGYHLTKTEVQDLVDGGDCYVHRHRRVLEFMPSSLIPVDVSGCDLPLIDSCSGCWYSYFDTDQRKGYWQFMVPYDCSTPLTARICYVVFSNVTMKWGLSLKTAATSTVYPHSFSNIPPETPEWFYTTVSSPTQNIVRYTDCSVYGWNSASTPTDRIAKLYIDYTSNSDSSAYFLGLKIEY